MCSLNSGVAHRHSPLARAREEDTNGQSRASLKLPALPYLFSPFFLVRPQSSDPDPKVTSLLIISEGALRWLPTQLPLGTGARSLTPA